MIPSIKDIYICYSYDIRHQNIVVSSFSGVPILVAYQKCRSVQKFSYFVAHRQFHGTAEEVYATEMQILVLSK